MNNLFRIRFVRIAWYVVLLVSLAFSLCSARGSLAVRAQKPNNDYFITKTITVGNGISLTDSIISGPPVPPPGYELERKAVVLPEPNRENGIATLTVPAFDWSFGCSATSASMIAAYYDRNGLSNMYTGPTNGGIMPLDSSSWPDWTDGNGDTYGQCPLTASHQGLDGRTILGSIDDYWVSYLSGIQDPYITNGWTQHTWGDAIGDYMKTSQSAYDNDDGSTSFYNYTSLAIPLTCSDMEEDGISQYDGTYGRKLFYEARGYTVSDCYNQKTDNMVSRGFSFAQYKAEIDAGRPVMLNLVGHTVVGVGYDDSTNTVYIHDTWDYDTHTMTWGGSYAGLQLYSVSIVNISTSIPTGTLSGTVTDSASAPIVGATIDVSGTATTVTDDTGHYALTLVAGTYSVTASKYGYVSINAPAVVITTSGTTTQDFTLATAPTSIISGVVTDATTGWPLYARIDIASYPDSPAFTDPVTGAYSVVLADGSYDFTVSAMSGGYTDAVASITVTGDATQDFGLTADPTTCTAPGYAIGFLENFETWPLPGWTIVDNVVGLSWEANTYYSDDNYTGGAGLAATVNSDNNKGVNYDTELISPVIDTASLATGTMLNYLANYQQYSSEALDLDIKVDGGAWTNLLRWSENHGTLYGTPGEKVELDLAPTITGSTNFQLRWHYYTPEGSPWDWYAQIDQVSIGSCSLISSSGLVVGAVFDANTSKAIANPSVTDTVLNNAVIVDNSADASRPHPMYIIGEPAGSISLTASALKYTSSTQTTTVVSGSTVRQDFNLPTGLLSASPTSLAFEVANGAPTASQPLTITNSGGAEANYEVFFIPGAWSSSAATGPFATKTLHVNSKHLNDMNASQSSITPSKNVTELAAGNVITSWVTGLTYAWGIGFNTDANDLWLSSPAGWGGDNFDYHFTTAGVNTGDKIDMTPWVANSAADMTYNPFTNMLWQVNVGGDDCIYELDPATKTSTGNSICPAFGTSERGLAFDPLTNTYYAGSWNDGILNHFTPDGTIIDSADVNLAISGLAFNPSTGHLFVMTNQDHSMGLFDVYVLDTLNAYAVVGAFNFTNGPVNALDDYGQSGLEIDCRGILWTVDHKTQKVYAADSGETGVCNWQASWLSTTPITGTVAAPGSALLAANVDATGMPVGTYQSYLRLVSNTPYDDEIVPVTLTVDTAPVADDQPVTTVEDTDKVITLTATDADGDALTYSVVVTPTHGVLTGSAPDLTYTPAANYNGSDSFTFKANDGITDSNIATVSITVTAVNDAPVADDQSVATNEDTAKDITLTAIDVDGDTLTYSVAVTPTHGVLTGSAPNLTYTPAAYYNGSDSFTFKANDGTADSNIATVSITVTAINDAPIADDQSITTDEDKSKAITLTATDAENDILTYTVIAGPSHGSLTGSAPNLTYTPIADYNGSDIFAFKANDGTADSNVATVSIAVTSVNDAPVITSDGGGETASMSVPENTTAVTKVTATDADGDTLIYSISGGADAAFFTIDASTGALSFISAPDFENPSDSGANNTYEVIVQVSDGALTDTQTITVNVTDVNETCTIFLPVVNR